MEASELCSLVGAVNNVNKAVNNLQRVLFILSWSLYIAIIVIIISGTVI
jgi:hypothetical protein